MKYLSQFIQGFAVIACSLSPLLAAQDHCGDDDACYFDNCLEPACCDNFNDANYDAWPFPNYLYVGYTGGRGIGYNKGYGTAGIFLSPQGFTSSNFQPFLDGKFYLFDKNETGGSVGLGLRYLPDSWDHVLGLNVYYDNRKAHHHVFSQVGVGFEFLGPNWDFRLNGYIPVNANHHHTVLFDLSGDFFAARRHRISAWSGVDAEFGAWLLNRTACNPMNLYCAVGPYYYFREHNHHWRERKHQTTGGRVRLFAKVTDYVELSVNATFDSIWHTRVQGQIALVIPLNFGCLKNDSCCDPCACRPIPYQPVQRNGIIVVDDECGWKWNWSGGCDSGSSDDRDPSSNSAKCPREHSWHSSKFSSGFFE